MVIKKINTNKLYSSENDVPEIENFMDDVDFVEIEYDNVGSDSPEKLTPFQDANDQLAIEEALPSKESTQDIIAKSEIEQVISSNNPDIVRKYISDTKGINLSKSQALDVIERFNNPRITEGSGRVRSESAQNKAVFGLEQELEVLKKQLNTYGEITPSTYSAKRASKKAETMYGKSMLQGPSKAGTGGVPIGKLNPNFSASKAYLEAEILVRETELAQFKKEMGKSDDVVSIENRLEKAGVDVEDIPLGTEDVSKVKNPPAVGIEGLTDQNKNYFIDDKIELYERDLKKGTPGAVSRTTKINKYLQGPGKYGRLLKEDAAQVTLNNIPEDVNPESIERTNVNKRGEDASLVRDIKSKKVYGTSSNMQYVIERSLKSDAQVIAELLREEAEIDFRQAEEVIKQERVIKDPEDGKLKKVSYTSLDAKPRDNTMVQAGPTKTETDYAQAKGEIGSSPLRDAGSKDFGTGWLDRQDKKLLSDSRLANAPRTASGKFIYSKKQYPGDAGKEMRDLAKAANEAEFRQNLISRTDQDLQSKIVKGQNVVDTPTGLVSRGMGDVKLPVVSDVGGFSPLREYTPQSNMYSGQGPRTPNVFEKVQGPGLTGKTLYEEQIGRKFARPTSGVGSGKSTNKGAGIRARDAKLKADASLAAKARKAVGLAYGAGKIAKAATKLNPALSMLSMLPKQTFDDILYNKKPQA